MKENEHLCCQRTSQLHKGLSSPKASGSCCCRSQCRNFLGTSDCDLAHVVVTALMCLSFLPSPWDTEQKLCPNSWESLESGNNLLLIPVLFRNERPICREQLEYPLFYLSSDFSSAVEKKVSGDVFSRRHSRCWKEGHGGAEGASGAPQAAGCSTPERVGNNSGDGLK